MFGISSRITSSRIRRISSVSPDTMRHANSGAACACATSEECRPKSTHTTARPCLASARAASSVNSWPSRRPRASVAAIRAKVLEAREVARRGDHRQPQRTALDRACRCRPASSGPTRRRARAGRRRWPRTSPACSRRTARSRAATRGRQRRGGPRSRWPATPARDSGRRGVQTTARTPGSVGIGKRVERADDPLDQVVGSRGARRESDTQGPAGRQPRRWIQSRRARQTGLCRISVGDTRHAGSAMW